MESRVNDLMPRASDALKALLGNISTVKLREIRHERPVSGGSATLFAEIEVCGHSHWLSCSVMPDGSVQGLKTAMGHLKAATDSSVKNAIPLVIAPTLSTGARALCSDNHTGFLDLEGNARIILGEVFIVKRSVTQDRSSDRSARRPAEIALRNDDAVELAHAS